MFYFAYGSDLDRKQLAERFPGCRTRFTASLPNYRLVFVGWSRRWRGGVASIQPSRGDKVMGGIYELPDNDLPRLDGQEGYPDVNDRVKVTVFRDTGDPVEAITYIYKKQPEENKPSAEYLALLRQGYLDWGLI